MSLIYFKICKTCTANTFKKTNGENLLGLQVVQNERFRGRLGLVATKAQKKKKERKRKKKKIMTNLIFEHLCVESNYVVRHFLMRFLHIYIFLYSISYKNVSYDLKRREKIGVIRLLHLHFKMDFEFLPNRFYGLKQCKS